MSDTFFRPEWIARRVEGVEIIDIDHFQRRVSLDVEMSRLPVAYQAHSTVLPIALVPYGLTLDFNLSGEGAEFKGPLSLLSSSERAQFKEQVLRDRVRSLAVNRWRAEVEILEDVCIRLLTFDTTTLEPVEPDDVSGPLEAEELIRRSVMAALGLLDDEQSIQVARDWAKMLSSTPLLDVINQFRMGNLLAVRFSDNSMNLERIKFDWIEFHRHLRTVDLNLGGVNRFARWRHKNFPITGYPFDLPIYDISRVPSTHIRVISPSGVFLGQASLLHEPSAAGLSVVSGASQNKYSYRFRETTSRSLLYSRNLPSHGTYYFVCTLWPRITGFLLPAAAITLFGALISIIGLSWEAWYQVCAPTLRLTAKHHPRMIQACYRPQAGFFSDVRALGTPIFAGLSLMVSLAVGLLVRDGEHDTRQWLLKNQRRNVLTSVLPILAAVTATMAPGVPEWLRLALWSLCAAISTTVFIMACWLFARRSMKTHRTVGAASGRTLAIQYEAEAPDNRLPTWLSLVAVANAVEEFVDDD